MAKPRARRDESERPAARLGSRPGTRRCRPWRRRARRGRRRARSQRRRARSATCARRPPRSGPARRPPRGGAWPGSPPPTGRRPRPRAPTRRARLAWAVVAARSSHAPVFTLPACAHTIVGRSGRPARARRPARPGPSRRSRPAATGSSASAPMPSSRSDRSIVAWRSSPASTRTGGAPVSPSASTSQPASASTRCRAAASATVFAPCAPVVMPNDASPGRPSRSLIHPADHRLRRGRGRRADGVERHLVPAGREHVGLRGGVERPADDEPEVARPGGRDEPRLDGRDELLDHRLGIGALVRQRAAERGLQRRPARPDARRGGRRPCAGTPRRARRCAGARRPDRTRRATGRSARGRARAGPAARCAAGARDRPRPRLSRRPSGSPSATCRPSRPRSRRRRRGRACP